MTNYISKIKLPTGNIYEIKDLEARQMLQNGIKFEICWDGSSAPDITKIPAGVSVTYNSTTYTGTMSANSADILTFYLVKSKMFASNYGIDNPNDVYDEYVAIGEYDPNSNPVKNKSWEKIGDTNFDFSALGALAYKDTVTLNKGAGDLALGVDTTFTASSSDVTFSEAPNSKIEVFGYNTTFTASPSSVSFSGGSTAHVLGTNATFTAAPSSVSFAAHTTKNALGTGATFTTTVNPSTTNIAATASGAAASTTTTSAVTGYANPASSSFLTGITPSSAKMVKTTITPVGSTTTASAVTKTDSKLATTSIPNVTSTGSASTWAFNMDQTDAEMLVISGSNGTAPTLGTAITAATGSVTSSGNGATIVTSVSATNKTVAVAGSEVNVATGAVTSSGTGDSILTGVSSTSDTAITGLGTPSTATVVTGVSISSQPTISISNNAAAGDGVVSVMTGISSASTSVNSADTTAAITALGAGTAAAQSISVTNAGQNGAANIEAITNLGTATAAAQTIVAGDNDLVWVYKNLPPAVAAAPTITVGSNDVIKVAKYDDLSISVS